MHAYIHTYTYNLDYTTREACIIRFHWLFVNIGFLSVSKCMIQIMPFVEILNCAT